MGSGDVPIVFEEVVGEVVSERETSAPEAPEGAAPEPDDLAQRMRREMALLFERAQRVFAD